MMVTLYSGQIQGDHTPIGDATPATLDRDVMLVYDGTFQSLDGEVTITPDHLRALAASHNARVDQLALASPAGINMADYPPVQLDHTSSARDTVGRVIGQLRVAEALIEGKSRMALFGKARFIGEENVRPASDGRWTNVSIGADLEPGKERLKELSVTPFPAAAKAALLSQGASMPKEKLKKYLMKSTKCSDKEADEKLGKMSDEDEKKLEAEADEDEKKMAAAEEDEKKKLAAEEERKKLADGDGDEDDKKKLAAKREKLIKLAAEAKAHLTVTTREAKRGSVASRLAKLRAAQKITPAEEKVLLGKLQAGGREVQLSEADDGALDLVFAVLDAREAVIPVGQYGTIKAVDLSAGGAALKTARMAEMEKEMLANMPSTRTMLKGANGGDELKLSDQVPQAATVQLSTARDVQDDHTAEAKDNALADLMENNTRMATLLEALTAAI